MTQREELYAERDPMELDEAGNYYFKHIMAITSEQLHSKSAIACELAYRDMLIDKLTKELQAAKAQAAPQWIPVNDSLPEHKDGLWSDPVIAMTDTGNIYRLSYCGGWQRTSEFMASGSSKVTHWMPLPAAPEQNK